MVKQRQAWWVVVVGGAFPKKRPTPPFTILGVRLGRRQTTCNKLWHFLPITRWWVEAVLFAAFSSPRFCRSTDCHLPHPLTLVDSVPYLLPPIEHCFWWDWTKRSGQEHYYCTFDYLLQFALNLPILPLLWIPKRCLDVLPRSCSVDWMGVYCPTALYLLPRRDVLGIVITHTPAVAHYPIAISCSLIRHYPLHMVITLLPVWTTAPTPVIWFCTRTTNDDIAPVSVLLDGTDFGANKLFPTLPALVARLVGCSLPPVVPWCITYV